MERVTQRRSIMRKPSFLSFDVEDEDDAWWIGWLILGLGLFCTVTVIAVEIIPRLRRARRGS